MKLIKKELKNKKEASLFSTRYKKIKFIEKRKVIRKINHINEKIKNGENSNEINNQLKDYQNKLLYIDVSFHIFFKTFNLFRIIPQPGNTFQYSHHHQKPRKKSTK